MNVELKRIAEKKIEQLGGDVCGVLVRKDGKLAAVDEHGRVQWLQSGQGAEPVVDIGTQEREGFWQQPIDKYTQSAQQGSVPDVGSMADVLGEWVRNTTGTALTHVTLVDMVRVMLATTSSPEALESERAANAMLTDRVEELETMVKVFRGCIETGMMPKPGSPCQRKVFELVGERGDV